MRSSKFRKKREKNWQNWQVVSRTNSNSAYLTLLSNPFLSQVFCSVSYFIDLFWQIKCNLSLVSQHENLHILPQANERAVFFLYRCKPLKKMSVETPEARSASSAICFDTVQKHHWISVWRLLQVIAVCEWLFWVCVCEPDNLHRKFHKNNDNFDKVILITKCVNKYLWSSVVNFVWCYHAANIDIRKSIRILLDFLTLISWDDDKDKRWTEISRWKKWV